VARVVVVTITAVPTTRRTNRRATARRRPAKRRPAGARRPARGQALRDRAAEQLRGHVIDVVAVGLAALGSITALALATDLVGPVGRLIDVAATSALGRGAGMLPVGCFAVAVLLLWSRPFLAEETGMPDVDAAPVASLRIGMGVSLVLLGIVGLMHLGGGSPSLDGSMSELRTAGGFAGAVVGGPLRAGLGAVGAVIVLLAATVLGVLLAPGVGVGERSMASRRERSSSCVRCTGRSSCTRSVTTRSAKVSHTTTWRHRRGSRGSTTSSPTR
jgi:S-DNA-T family DNA segregation ATPase FtsK/SpoIIIE